jgi:hypothetical protein
VLVSIIRACHALFPVAHSFAAKNNLFDAQVSASAAKAKLTAEVKAYGVFKYEKQNAEFHYANVPHFHFEVMQSSIPDAYLELEIWNSTNSPDKWSMLHYFAMRIPLL